MLGSPEVGVDTRQPGADRVTAGSVAPEVQRSVVPVRSEWVPAREPVSELPPLLIPTIVYF